MLNENFKTTVKENKTDIDILFAKYDIATQLNIKEEQIESVEINDLTIDWNLYLEIRSWGVKTISVFAYNVFTYLHADNDDVEAKEKMDMYLQRRLVKGKPSLMLMSTFEKKLKELNN